MLRYLLLTALAIAAVSASSNTTTYLPTVMWHGMGDSCCNPFSMGRIKRLIENALPGIYVYSVMIGKNVIADTEHGFIGSVNDQIQEVCDKIANDPLLKNGFNAVGFSQGSQFIRGVAERCPNPKTNNLIGLAGQHQGVFGLPSCTADKCETFRTEVGPLAYIERAIVQRCSPRKVRNLISFGGQHQGIYGLPHCPSSPADSRICEYIRKLIYWGAYDAALQNHFVQAQYWHDPINEDTYKNFSVFLADINNEREINEAYKNNIMALANFVLVKFLQDSVVIPRESEWFGFYTPGQDTEILSLQDSPLYLEDRLGLKALNDASKLQFLEVEGDHLEFTDEWFLDAIVTPYLSTEVDSNGTIIGN